MIRPFRYLSLIIPAALLSAFAASAQPDSLRYALDSTVFVSRLNTSGIRGTARRLDMATGLVSSLPRVLGSSDPLRYIQYLPGVQTNSEYDNGIRIYGCDNVHNQISLDGIPVYGATHFLGLFSVFNPGHFKSLSFSTQPMVPNRLGGEVNMAPKTMVPDKVRGDFEAGLISAQASVDVPLGPNCSLGIAVRKSYLNLLYSRFLEVEGCPLGYSFFDSNLSFAWDASPSDKVWAEAYFGRDKVRYLYSPLSADFSIDWGNVVAGAGWRHEWTGGASMTNRVYFTRFGNGLRLDQDMLAADVPSNIRTVGYSSEASAGGWEFGVDVLWHKAMPQYPTSYWNTASSEKEIQDAVESSIWSSRCWEFDSGWTVDAFLKLSSYLSPERKMFWGVSPSLRVGYDFHRYGRLDLRGGAQTQYLFQTGVSNTGLPVEFYFLAGKHCAPQRSLGAELDYDVQLFSEGLSLSASAYYKHLLNQVEYCGNILDLLLSDYSLDNSLFVGSGDNYGLTLMARKNSGNLTGWVSYSLGRSLRHFNSEALSGTFPSSHERIHQLNAVGNYKLGRWEFGGSFVLASGTPFTAPESYYILGGQLMSDYGGFNQARMPAYIRLDLSVNWYIHRDSRCENGLNLSIYNVLCRENSMSCRMNVFNGKYSYGSIALPMQFLPSIGYFHRF